jgi:hypothetical protein
MFYEINSNDPHKIKIMLLFVRNQFWNPHITFRLCKDYNLIIGYVDELINDGTVNFAAHLNQICQAHKVDLIILNNEFYHELTPFTIRLLKTIRPTGLMVFDPILSPSSLLLSKEASFVLTACPLLSIQLECSGILSMFFPLESEAYHSEIEPASVKDIDILFFGTINDLRKPFIEKLENLTGFNIFIQQADVKNLSYQDLYGIIKRSKISINLSKFRSSKYIAFNKDSVSAIERNSDYIYGLKGRIQESAFARTLCISEYTPQLNILGIDKITPQFKTPDEMIDLIHEILISNQLEIITQKFVYGIKSIFSDRVVLNKFSFFISSLLNSDDARKPTNNLYNKSDLEVFSYYLTRRFGSNKLLLEQELDKINLIAFDIV